MKKKIRSKHHGPGFPKRAVLGRSVIGASLIACGAHARAADTNAPALTPEQQFEGGEKSYDNWVEFSAGGLLTHGVKSEAEQQVQSSAGAFGGIQDLHYQKDVSKGTTVSLDGESIFDNHDYKIKLALVRDEFGYVRVGFENFRTWSSSVGGSFNPDGLHYSLGSDALTLDRGQVTFEAGLTKKDLPKLTFKYTHWYRDGDKSSTSWGPVPTSAGIAGIVPGFYDLNEKSDSFQIDGSYKIKKTDLGLGLRYEMGDMNDAHKLKFYYDPSNPTYATDRQHTTYDTLSVHTTTETWLKKDLFLSTGFMYANLDSDFTGNRIYGDNFDVPYSPFPELGYLDLNGGAHKNEYVGNINLQATPFKNFIIVPSLRVQKEDWNANSDGTATRDSDTAAFTGQASRDLINVRERLDARYTGFTNWVVWARGEWTEQQGNLKANGGIGQVNGIGTAPIVQDTDDSQWYQKYSAGVRWYPVRQASIDAGGFYLINQYNYNNIVDSTPNNLSTDDAYPAFLVFQDFKTYDGNIRLTLRPLKNVTLVSRYDYQLSTIDTKPDPVSGLTEVESSRMTRHMFAQNASWTPLNWLSLQAGFNYVSSVTETPASQITQAILNSQNNYYTINFNAGFILDEKTSLDLGCFYYRADDYANNSAYGLPLGAGAEEQGVTARLSRRITKNLRLNLKYAFTHYTDAASNGADNYDAHVIFSSLQYRF